MLTGKQLNSFGSRWVQLPIQTNSSNDRNYLGFLFVLFCSTELNFVERKSLTYKILAMQKKKKSLLGISLRLLFCAQTLRLKGF